MGSGAATAPAEAQAFLALPLGALRRPLKCLCTVAGTDSRPLRADCTRLAAWTGSTVTGGRMGCRRPRAAHVGRPVPHDAAVGRARGRSRTCRAV